MPRYSTVEAIVIKKTATQESDLRITLLTKNLGKINAIAKGTNSILSSRLSTLQLGNIIKVHLYNNLNRYWISEAVTTTPFLFNHKNLTQYQLLFLVLEITNQLLAEEQNTNNIYDIICHLIQNINQNHFIRFISNELELLRNLGFGVPEEIALSFSQKNYRQTQVFLKNYLESIIEKPLRSNLLFR